MASEPIVAMSDAAVVGAQAAAVTPPAAAPTDFAEGEWIHVKIAPDGTVEDVIRPEHRTWHETVNMLMTATHMARDAEMTVITSLYGSLAAAMEEKVAKARAVRNADALRPQIRRLFRGR
jgi:hypothetical protein